MVANIFSMGSAWPSQRRLASLVGLVGEALLTDSLVMCEPRASGRQTDGIRSGWPK
jgi:hypothetical protein